MIHVKINIPFAQILNEQQIVILHNYVIWKYAESASSEQNNNIVILVARKYL